MLKPLDAIQNADDRFQYLSVHDAKTGHLRPIRLEDLHEEICPLELNQSVPKEIRQQFDLARNIYLYAWFTYDFFALAEQHAYVVLEMGLKHRSTVEKLPKISGLRAYLKAALMHGWIQKEELDLPGPPSAKQMSFLDELPRLRNKLSHGDIHLAPDWTLQMLKLCAYLLNRLYSEVS